MRVKSWNYSWIRNAMQKCHWPRGRPSKIPTLEGQDTHISSNPTNPRDRSSESLNPEIMKILMPKKGLHSLIPCNLVLLFLCSSQGTSRMRKPQLPKSGRSSKSCQHCRRISQKQKKEGDRAGRQRRPNCSFCDSHGLQPPERFPKIQRASCSEVIL